ncbi:hypothetical protein ACEPAF_9353 [Sanghuangporus sanghuang]
MNGHTPYANGLSHINGKATNRSCMDGTRVPSTQLDIIVIGGGIGGLAAALCLALAGHNVSVFEAARKLREVGAGLQVSPNVTRLMTRWGMADRMRNVGVEPQALVFRRYVDGSIVGRTLWGAVISDEFGAPYYHMHRSDLQRILLERAQECPNVSFRVNSRVRSIDPHPDNQGKVAIALVDGEIFEADLIIGADGVHSLSRQIVCGRAILAQHTGDAAYRTVIPTERMMEDEELRALVENPELTTWMGPGRHIMGYCISAKKGYNLVMFFPDRGSEESYTAEGDVEEMRKDFADFEPRVRKLLQLVDRTLMWRLDGREPLQTWLHSAGRLVLLGDACHPMLPYRAQGAAMAIEDAAVLGNLLSRLGPPHVAGKHLVMLLKAYEKLRLRRTAETQETSALNKYTFHLDDGPEQEARDASMRRAMLAEERAEATETASTSASPTPTSDVRSAGSGGSGGFPRARNAENANQWADRKKNQTQYGYDADAEVERWWIVEGEKQLRRLLGADDISPDTSTLSSTVSKKTVIGKRSFWRKLLGKKDNAILRV